MPENSSILLATHIDPPIHGQAVMAAQLMDVSADWSDIELIGLNTVYANKRSELKGFAFKKACKLLKYALKARRLIKKHKVSHVILCPAFFKGPFLKDSFLARFLKLTTNAKLIAWVHMDPNRLDIGNEKSTFAKYVIKTTNKFSLWVSCSQSLQIHWPEWLTRNNQLSSVPNAIKAEKLDHRARSEDLICKVAYLSSIDDEKGWRELLNAAEKLCELSHDYQFDFYGGIGANLDEGEVVSAFKNIGHSNRIKWHGPIYGEAKFKALSEATIFVLPSHTEQFPITILEAMSQGLPIVATDVGAIKDALPKQKLIEPNSPDLILKAITRLWEEKQLLDEQSRSNYEHYVSNYSKEAFSNQWRKLLQSQL